MIAEATSSVASRSFFTTSEPFQKRAGTSGESTDRPSHGPGGACTDHRGKWTARMLPAMGVASLDYSQFKFDGQIRPERPMVGQAHDALARSSASTACACS